MRTFRPPFRTFLLLLLCAAGPASAGPEQAAFAPSTEVSDIPTAATLYARMFNLNTRLFRGGGLVLKASASFNNSLQLGVGFKANNLIGGGDITLDDQPEQVVSALAKLRLISMPAIGLQAALGYDGMGYDITRKHGIHGVVSKDVSAGILIFRAHLGVGVVRFRDAQADRDINAFCGISGALSEDLHLGLEWDDMFYNDKWVNTGGGTGGQPGLTSSERLRDGGSFNAMIGYAWDVGLRLELDFKNLFRGRRAYHRVFKILYTF